MNKAEVAAYEAKKLAAEAEGRRLPPEELVRPRLSFDTCLQALAAEEKVDLRTTGAQTDGTATKFTRLKTFPDYLVFQLKKFTVGQDWTPKKLDVSVDIPHSLDISFLRAQGLQPNEVLLPEEAQTKKAPAVDDTVVQHIMEMGFHANAARKAVIHTGNCGSEAATNWIMQHLDDTDLNDPISDDVCGADATFTADPDAVENIQLMGFTAEQAAKALRATDNNIERAVDWIFSHQDELNSSTSPASNANNLPQNKYTDGSGKYDLMGFISHMGSSSMVGHYVCHILKDGKWAIFNDNKVALSENLPKDLGYLYFYKRSTL
jgi:ubiquitin carboxyl-terminal hydrolase 5/13